MGNVTGITDPKPLSGRHAVVTGGGRGIGATIAETLAAMGADVTVVGRNRANLDERAAAIADKHGVKAGAESIDLADPAAIESGFAALTKRLGAPAILVNNAGIALAAPFHRTDLELWNKVMSVDLTAAFLCTRQVLKGMIDGGYGRVINVASTAGLTGFPYVTAYCAAKHGMIGLTRALAREVATKPVTINAVCPGYTDTDIVADALNNITSKTGRSREEALAELVSHNPQGRLIQPREVADTIGFLCLDTAASITGQSLLVAGGELM